MNSTYPPKISYDDKRGQKSLEITKKLKNRHQSKFCFQQKLFFIISFLYESTKNKI